MEIKCSRCGTKNKIIETEQKFICMKCFWKNYVNVGFNTPFAENKSFKEELE